MGRRARRRAAMAALPLILTIVALLAAWEAAVDLFKVPAYLLPPPSRIATYTATHLDLLAKHSVVTLWEIAVGFAASAIVGFPLGVLLAGSGLLARTVYPLLVASQTFPKLAIAPLFIVWFGFGYAPKLLVVFLIAFFPIVIDTAVGLRSVDRDTLDLARSIGLGRAHTFLKIRLPQALPSIFAGLKIAITLAVVGAIVGEFLGTDTGLGYLIIQATGNVDTPMLFSALLTLTVLGAGLYGLASAAERMFVPWYADDPDRMASGSM